ncbi:MAG TPA: branched-chain amino acid ABC transporter substrate-binding protein [Solirubrobacteraceae bacterium]
MRRLRPLLLLGALACLAGCGPGEPSGKIHGTTLTVYYSGPSRGASSIGSQAALYGAVVALDAVHAHIGKYRVDLRPLDDGSFQSQGWDPNQTTTNVRLAAQDPTTIGYLGDFNSGATAISIPPLNRASIAQISPAATAVGLTSAGPGADPGEPQKYYPSGIRTFARPVPSDAVQAQVQVRLAGSLGCRQLFVLHDGEVDGEDEALTFVLTAQSRLRVIGVQEFPRRAPDYGSLALSVARTGADCVLISAVDERSSARLTDQLAESLPHASIIASSELADSAYVDPTEGGVSRAAARRVLITSPALEANDYPPSGQAFLAAYARRYGTPEPDAIFGYEAMSLMLAGISAATDHGRKDAVRSNVAGAILKMRDRHSALGNYGIDRDGDTTLRRYGIYKIAHGQLSMWHEVG